MNVRIAAAALSALALALAGALCATARAESTRALFDQGNRELMQGAPREAISRYETLTELGVRDADLELNLAIAEAELGHLGRSLWHLQRAHDLRPLDDQVREGMARVQDALGKRKAEQRGEATVQVRPPLLEAMFDWLSRDVWAIVLWIAVAVASGAWLWLQRARREGARLGAGVTIASALLLTVLAATGLTVRAGLTREGRRAIVLEDDVALREGPDPKAPRSASLDEGTRVTILEQVAGYARVSNPGNDTGWVQAERLGEY